MYIPTSFAETDLAALHTFIERHSFATVVSHDGGQPLASHLPLLLDRKAEPLGRLIGHMARANTQWRTAARERVLAIFHGPHAYISPSWCAAANVVPTWNYVAVHAYGIVRLIDDRRQVHDVIRRTVETYEAALPRPWSLASQDAGFIDRLLDSIVAFDVEIERIEGKWKLNQNHPAERRQKVAAALRASGDHQARQIADLMAEAIER